MIIVVTEREIICVEIFLRLALRKLRVPICFSIYINTLHQDISTPGAY